MNVLVTKLYVSIEVMKLRCPNALEAKRKNNVKAFNLKASISILKISSWLLEAHWQVRTYSKYVGEH